MAERVLITGLGAITPLGLDMPSTWAAMLRGQSGVVRISRFDTAKFPSKIAAEVQGFDPAVVLGPKVARRTSRVSQFSIVAAREAVADARLRPAAEDPYRVGCLIGVSGTAVEGVTDLVMRLHDRGPTGVPVLVGTIVPPNMAA